MISFTAATLDKARRLLEQERVLRAPETETYRVDGDHDSYFVTVSADGRNAYCPCPTRGPTCSHTAAVLLSIREGLLVPVYEIEDVDNPFDGLADVGRFEWEVDR